MTGFIVGFALGWTGLRLVQVLFRGEGGLEHWVPFLLAWTALCIWLLTP